MRRLLRPTPAGYDIGACPTRESPTEIFKRALAHAARSLAEQPDLEVVFSGDGPSLAGHRAVLPHPPRELSGPETTRIRGLADQMALRVAHHDDAVHARSKPRTQDGGQVYDALEQARIEAIGANALAGVRDNLAAVLEQSIQRKGYAHLVDPAAAPMADIVALMVRERLTGEPPPAGAQALVDAFRAEIEAKAGADLDRLTGAVEDQKAFARIARAVVRDLSMGDDLSDAPDQDAEDDESQDGEAESCQRRRRRRRGAVARERLARRQRKEPSRSGDGREPAGPGRGGRERRTLGR